jgi:hypothetical protein
LLSIPVLRMKRLGFAHADQIAMNGVEGFELTG